MRLIFTLFISALLFVSCGSNEDAATKPTTTSTGVTPTSLGETIAKAACACKTAADGKTDDKYNQCYQKATEEHQLLSHLLKYKPEQLKEYERVLDKIMKECK